MSDRTRSFEALDTTVCHEHPPTDVGRIIQDEQDENVKVEMATYKRLYRGVGGIWILLLVNFIMMSFVFCNIAVSFMT